jgi:hypothetical protein
MTTFSHRFTVSFHFLSHPFDNHLDNKRIFLHGSYLDMQQFTYLQPKKQKISARNIPGWNKVNDRPFWSQPLGSYGYCWCKYSWRINFPLLGLSEMMNPVKRLGGRKQNRRVVPSQSKSPQSTFYVGQAMMPSTTMYERHRLSVSIILGFIISTHINHRFIL